MEIERRQRVVGRRQQDVWNVWDKRIRDIGIYVVAIAGVVNQIFFTRNPSETVLVFLAAMLGFPLILRADENRRVGSTHANHTDEEEDAVDERRQRDDRKKPTRTRKQV